MQEKIVYLFTPLSHLLYSLCHSHENGNPDSINAGLDSRIHGNDR